MSKFRVRYNSYMETIEVIKKWLGAGSINIFGMPLSGKDTQGRTLATLLDAPLIGGGEIIRASDNEPLKEIIGRGELAPTEDYIAMVTPYFAKAEFADKPLVLSSVGRWHGEEEAIVKAATAGGHPIKAVLFLDLPEDEVYRRLELLAKSDDRSNRTDDSSNLLGTRFNEFRTKTVPVIEYYRAQGLLIEINGNQPREAVEKEIIDKLSQQAKKDKA